MSRLFETIGVAEEQSKKAEYRRHQYQEIFEDGSKANGPSSDESWARFHFARKGQA
ncbi:hypothetical protein GGR39_001921 [Novosphingobium fluoreni]|uniref:Uncharacterized protein n=1 Tax=Novosphingobium fluoreni TaxID=1391222 RepID=A0A7W6BYH6_9SPHN|nr:hypothetical protein [Novosphingobium fluoreni]MBB3940264.1 hypothetical protein [Novosphingobium fluoreni]